MENVKMDMNFITRVLVEIERKPDRYGPIAVKSTDAVEQKPHPPPDKNVRIVYRLIRKKKRPVSGVA